LRPVPRGNDEWAAVVTASGEGDLDGGERVNIAWENFELPARSLLLLRR
jgi:hypothetical protein